jgi:hypothetical protein
MLRRLRGTRLQKIGINYLLNNMTEAQDMTMVEKIGGKNEGCKEGFHTFDSSSATMHTSGALTGIAMKCIECGKMVDVASDLGMNDLLEKYSGDSTVMQGAMQQTREEPSIPSDDAILNKLFGK